MKETFLFGATSVEIDHDNRIVTTRLCGHEDVNDVTATPPTDEEGKARAKALGYTDSDKGLWHMTYEHELLHSLMAYWLFERESKTLLGVATGRYHKHWHAEECMILAMQKHINVERDISVRGLAIQEATSYENDYGQAE